MSVDKIVAVVAIVMCLILAWRNLRGRQLEGGTTVKMAIAWILIIAAVALGARLLGA